MIKVVLSPDRLRAYLSIDVLGDAFPDERALHQALGEAGVVYGIDQNLISDIAKDKKMVDSVLVAQGDPGEGCRDALLTWHIDLEDGKRPAFTEMDRADYKHLRLFQQAQKDKLLIEKTPAQNGQNGKGVTGEVLDGKGRDIDLPVGKNTYLSEDGLKLFAAIDGFAFWDQQGLHIDNIYHIRGNVDYNTGNVNFQGAVVIEGDVRSGFRVEASDYIFIGGTVGAASIYSQRGDITIECGVVGKGRAKIISGGNLTCGFIQDAVVGVKGDIDISHYAINSNISAGGSIRLTQNEGLIRGGHLTAGICIDVLEAGSDQDKYTQLSLVNSESSAYHANIWDVNRRYSEAEKYLASLLKRVRFIEVLRDGGKRLSPEIQSELRQLEGEIDRLRNDLTQLSDEQQNTNDSKTQTRAAQTIVIRSVLHRNVQIAFGFAEWYSQEVVRNVFFTVEDGAVVMHSQQSEHVEIRG